MRVLAVDWGSKRIGLAVGESEFGITRALPMVEARGALDMDAETIGKAAKREDCKAIVVGLPLNTDGSLSEMAKICLQLSERLRVLGYEIFTVDESLSSVEAESSLYQSGLKAAARKRKRDSAAATLILERFFYEQGKEKS